MQKMMEFQEKMLSAQQNLVALLSEKGSICNNGLNEVSIEQRGQTNSCDNNQKCQLSDSRLKLKLN
jgi:hypothetical protein